MTFYEARNHMGAEAFRPGVELQLRDRSCRLLRALAVAVAALLPVVEAAADPPPGEGPNLGPRLTQQQVESELTLEQIRREGLRIFSTPFNRHDGLGDGPVNPSDTISFGGRPTLGNNGFFLRMNGLDSQTCLECHSVLSNAVIPATFAVGGVGGVAANAFPGVVDPDLDDSEGNGFAAFQGRAINPPFNFGAGGVELLAKEMTADLQALAAEAAARPGVPVDLISKGIDFGWVVFEAGRLDTSHVEGIDADDLVVRPFGRKGCCATIRDFDIGALQFHHGIQPVEVVGGEDVDADGDGVANELTVGELSALHLFQVSLPAPAQRGKGRDVRAGRALFEAIGCADCHVPVLETEDSRLPVSFPEIHTDPFANVYRVVDLGSAPADFRRSGRGVAVPLFADLKRHDMGPGLAENIDGDLDPFFTTARLWGVADTAPYLHDGRAATLTDAILLHGGEAQTARDAFEALGDAERRRLLAFLRSLRTPLHPNADLIP